MSGCVCLATRKIWRKLQIKHSQRTQLLSFGTYCHGNMLLSRRWSWQISRRQLSCENDCTSWKPIAIRRACWCILGNRKPYLLYQPPQHSHSGNLNSSLDDKLSKLLLGIWIRLTRLGEIRKSSINQWRKNILNISQPSVVFDFCLANVPEQQPCIKIWIYIHTAGSVVWLVPFLCFSNVFFDFYVLLFCSRFQWPFAFFHLCLYSLGQRWHDGIQM